MVYDIFLERKIVLCTTMYFKEKIALHIVFFLTSEPFEKLVDSSETLSGEKLI